MVKFSFVIPIGKKRSVQVLDHLEKLDYDKNNFEIIVRKGKSPSANRNRGIKKAKGEYVIFLNGHSIVKSDYLKKLEAFLAEHNFVEIVGGPQLTFKKGGFFEDISDLVLTSHFGAFKVNKRYQARKEKKIIFNVDETFLTSANLCVKKSVFEKIKGFNEKLWPGEDPEFIFRAKAKGIKVAYNPEIFVYHKRRPTFSLFVKQFFYYGLTRPKKNKINNNTQFVFLVPMVFAIYFMLIPILTLVSLIFLAPFLLYLVLAVLFSFYDSIRGYNFLGFFVIPSLYLFLHMSYGLGMLVGYFQN